MTEITIEFNDLLEVIQKAAATEEKLLHIQAESALKNQLRQTVDELKELRSNWDKLTETIELLFIEYDETYHDVDEAPRHIDLVISAKRKIGDLEDKLKDYIPF